MLKPNFLLSLLLVSLAVVFVGCSTQTSNSQPGSSAADVTKTSRSVNVGTAIGDSAPEFELTTLDGATVTLASLKSQPAVLVFWTAWCPVCKEEAPYINQLAASFEPRGVRVLGVNIQDSLARTEGGIRDFGIRYSVARDANASVARRYKVTGTPTIIFLDKSGTIRYFGNELPDDYPARLDVLLNESG